MELLNTIYNLMGLVFVLDDCFDGLEPDDAADHRTAAERLHGQTRLTLG